MSDTDNLPNMEVIDMVEKMLEGNETLLMDMPYLRRMREIGREEGVQIGREEGVQIGREEGVEIGIRETILKGVIRKFDPKTSDFQPLEQKLAQIHKVADLQRIVEHLFDANELDEIVILVNKVLNNGSESQKDKQ